ncbi:hypothetical protein HPB50_001818 [Hyalomma asiaticum]|uniref:Uncharacterized protein n=1 Tax=Hyalomma asiaticum TaxID=266040 RepID=A0ACB7SUT7_HYAAI|nr:hypothetical protein HPB50_001818 [Hyalomma asiaticum]
MAKERSGFPSTAASLWTEPREELAKIHQPQQQTPPDQYLGIDTATLYSLSLQSEDRGAEHATWAPFIYAYGLLVLVLGFLLIYFLIKVGGRASGPRKQGSEARKLTERATVSPPGLRTVLPSMPPTQCSTARAGSSRRHSGHTTASFRRKESDADNATDGLTTYSTELDQEPTHL